MLNRWVATVEHPYNILPNFGIAVLVVPLPGREGFGPEFYNALADGRNFGQIDIDEQTEIVGQMVAQGWTAPDRIGITGCSYGGYCTTQSLSRHPTTYAAGHTQCSLLDLFQEWQFGFTPFTSYLMGVLPTIDSTEYVQDSPYYNAADIQVPLLIYHGSDDFLPIQIVSNLHNQLAALYRPVDYYRFEKAGHGLGRPDYQFIAGQQQIRWFREQLGQE
jgi:dipeptidyl aminopeptidase/acylaminoacyl peptidase